MLVSGRRSVVTQPAALSRTHSGVTNAPSYASRRSKKSPPEPDDERL